jgi:GNAT superfamily N-acetyltransferase
MEQLNIKRASLSQIGSLRARFLQENQFQIRFDSVHHRGWADEYLIMGAGVPIGYASIKGFEDRSQRDSLFEYYLLPDYRDESWVAFQLIANQTAIRYIECQTNESLLSSIQHLVVPQIHIEALLFGAPFDPRLSAPDGCVFRMLTDADYPLFEHKSEPEGPFGIEKKGKIVATGGYLTHYNPPFVDLYMEVHPDHRHMGIGSYLIQEIQKVCIEEGLIPAARCNADNIASQRTLLRGGLNQVGTVTSGSIRF